MAINVVDIAAPVPEIVIGVNDRNVCRMGRRADLQELFTHALGPGQDVFAAGEFQVVDDVDNDKRSLLRHVGH